MKKCALAAALFLFFLGSAREFLAAAPDIVLYASDVTAMYGNWSRIAASGAAGGQTMNSTDYGWSTTDNPLASPSDYFEAAFTAAAGTPYHVWLRLRAGGNSKYNDSVWVQFGDAVDASGAALYRIGTTSALLVNLENCSNCGVSGWGWMDGSWWLSQIKVVRFASAGSHTIRVQTREDGVQVDQIVLSPSTYLSSAPGPVENDATIVPKPSSSGSGSTPFSGTPASIPGTIQAVSYDKGGEGIAYHDTTPGNSGGAYRSDDVDMEASADGGYDVGWIDAGEWLNYSVSVASAGSYVAQLRVASPGGGALHVSFGGPSSTSGSATIPATGDWQAWTTVTIPLTLASGTQMMTVSMDTNGFNIGAMTFAKTSGGGGGGGGGTPTPFSGTPAAIPGTIQAEDFDNGGEGVAYHDTTSGNSGGQYRSTDVDIEAASSGGYDVGWMDVGEWLGYTVNVASAGSYTVQFRVAAAGNGGSFHLEVGGQNVTGPLTIPNTGGWQSWTTVSSSITLAAGTQFARFVIDSMNAVVGNLDSMTFTTTNQVSGGGSGGATITVPAGGDLQAAIDQAQQGDTILLVPGATYSGGFGLPAKSGSGTITIRSAAPDSSLPAAGVRITPDYAGNLPKIQGTVGTPALYTEPGAHDYKLMFLELTSSFYGSDLVDFGDGSSQQTSVANIPQNLVLDRCYLHGDPSNGQKRGVGLNSATASVVNSYISGIMSNQTESQAIAGWNGPGPYTITNNYLEAGSENILFGGADPSIPGLVPSDILISRNHIAKPTSWANQGFSIKNLIELKNAQRVTIDGNLIENVWYEAQAGYAIVLTPRNQGGTAPWSAVQDITITNNVVQHAAGAFDVLGTDNDEPSQPLTDVKIANNLFMDIGTNWGGNGWFMVTLGGDNVRLDHNTIFSTGSSVIYSDVAPVTNFSFTNNILPPATWSIDGSGQGPGNSTIGVYFPGSWWAANIITGAPSNLYPANNYFPASVSDIGFVDAGGNFRLASGSNYKGTATDGTDVGANIDAINAAAGTSY